MKFSIQFLSRGAWARLFSISAQWRGRGPRGSANDQIQKGRASSRAQGFTLLELLIVVAIVAVLATLVLGSVSAVQRRGRQMKETNAAKQLIAAYLTYPLDHEGELMLGYDKTAESVSLGTGRKIDGEVVNRYPWRIAPLLGRQIDDIFLLNGREEPTTGMDPESHEYLYRVSLNPPLGINAYCVGGYDDGSQSGYFTKDVVSRMSQAHTPSNLIVFASARMKQNAQSKELPGNFIVQPPLLWRMKWDKKFDREKAAANFGNVDLRWDNKALCAFMDGSIRLLGEDDLLDMRLWSNTAAQTDNPVFSVPR